MMMPSKSLTGRPLFPSFNASMTKTSKDVRMTPAHNGSLGNIKVSAIADPINSARSVETIAVSATSQVDHCEGLHAFNSKKKQITYTKHTKGTGLGVSQDVDVGDYHAKERDSEMQGLEMKSE